MPYFDEPVGRVKIQTTSKILSDTTQQNVLQEIYYPTHQIVMSERENFADIHLRGMHDTSMRSGTKLARKIQVNSKRTWHTGFCRFDRAIIGAIYFTFHHGKKSSLDRPKYTSIQVFTLRFLSRKNVKKKFVLTNKIFFRNFNPIRRLRLARKPVYPVLWSTNTA